MNLLDECVYIIIINEKIFFQPEITFFRLFYAITCCTILEYYDDSINSDSHNNNYGIINISNYMYNNNVSSNNYNNNDNID